MTQNHSSSSSPAKAGDPVLRERAVRHDRARHHRWWLLDRPVKPGDDEREVVHQFERNALWCLGNVTTLKAFFSTRLATGC